MTSSTASGRLRGLAASRDVELPAVAFEVKLQAGVAAGVGEVLLPAVRLDLVDHLDPTTVCGPGLDVDAGGEVAD